MSRFAWRPSRRFLENQIRFFAAGARSGDGSRPGQWLVLAARSDNIITPGAALLNSRHDPRRAPTSRLKPTSSAVPTASAKQENNNNNEEQRLNIHDVHSFSAMAALACPQYLSSTSYGDADGQKKKSVNFVTIICRRIIDQKRQQHSFSSAKKRRKQFAAAQSNDGCRGRPSSNTNQVDCFCTSWIR